jgi:hypothetical protein
LVAASRLADGGLIVWRTSGFAIARSSRNPVVQVDPPGDSLFRFSYRVSLHAAEDALEKSLPYGADLLRVVAEEGGPRVSGSTLTFEQTVDGKGSKLLVWAAHDLPPGTRLSIELSDLPGPPAWATRIADAVAWPWIAGGLVALVPLLGVFWTLRGRLRTPVLSA